MKIKTIVNELRKQASAVMDHDAHLTNVLTAAAALIESGFQPESEAESITSSLCQLGLRHVLGTFVSAWDDGETIVSCPCVIDLVTRHIAYIDTDSREVWSSDDSINEDNVDDAVELLDEQYVIIGEDTPMNHFPAAQKDDLPEGDEKTYWYD